MSAHDISEAFDGLRSAILADSTFAAMLGISDGIYLSPPESKESPSLPLVEWKWAGWNTQGFTSTGVYRPKLTMNVFAVTPQACFAILGYLERYWTIPKHRVAGVTTTNFVITHLEMGSPVHVGAGRLLNSNRSVHQVAADWDLRINKR